MSYKQHKALSLKSTSVLFSALFFACAIFVTSGPAAAFTGGGGSIYLGTGYPSSIDAVDELSEDLRINEEEGNFNFGLQGFYQADKYRLGADLQWHLWGGSNPGDEDDDVDADTAGVGAVTYGMYTTYTIRHDRLLLNVGGVVGAGVAFLGYDYGQRDVSDHETVSTFYIEPLISFGVGTCRYFGVEFQASAPIFVFSEDLTLDYLGKEYTVKGSELNGVNFAIKLTFGKIADV